MLPSATPLAQCFIELLRETAANRGFLRTDLETICTPRDGSESRLFEDRSRHNLTEFLFWRSRLLFVKRILRHDTLRVPSPQSRVQPF